MSVAIVGIGLVSAIGCGVDELRSGMEGKAKPTILQQSVQTPDGTQNIPYYEARIAGLENFISASALRRMSRFSQMALLASYLAVKDSDMDLTDTARVGIIFGSGYGPLQAGFNYLDSLIDNSDSYPSPTSFATSVHNSLASLVSISMNIRGPSLTLSAFDLTGSSVFSIAELWLQKKSLDYVLIGLGEECCPVRGYATALITKTKGAIHPFRLNDCTYVPGEGFVCFLLGKENRAFTALTCESGVGESSTALNSSTVFIAANGDQGTGRYYEYLLNGDRQVRSFSPLFGSMPVGIAFEAASAAVCLREKVLYASPITEYGNDAVHSIAANAAIVCIQYDESGTYTLLKLSGAG